MRVDAHEIHSCNYGDSTATGSIEGASECYHIVQDTYEKMEQNENLGLRSIPIEYSDDFTRFDIWSLLECDDVYQYERPIHSPLVWRNMRALYRTIVNGRSTIGDEKDDVFSGFHAPVTAKLSPDKGRGIYATADIPSGSIVWSTQNTARFTNASHYRQFLFRLEDPLACDVLNWAYIQPIIGDHGVNLLISVDLDEGSFCNDGTYDESGVNIGCDVEAAKDYNGGCRENYFALRDISAGEELLCAYTEFAIADGWIYYGL